MKHLPQILATAFFLALLALPLVLKPFYASNTVEFDRESALETFGFYFEEVSRKSAVNFVHQAPKLDPKLNNIMPQIASMGAGVAVADFDNDGWNDLYLTNSSIGSKNALYKNKKDGTFEEVAERAGVGDINLRGASMGAVWGDHNNDGLEDLLVYKWGETELFENVDGKRFVKLEGTGFPSKANINSAIWLDYDLDGRLDVFLGGYFREDIDLWNLKDTKIMPESFEYATNGGRNYLFRNLGGGRFEDVAAKAGLTSTRWTLAAVSADFNGDAFPDLFVSNDYGISEFYLNVAGKKFNDISAASGVGFSPKSGMNASVGDVFNNGSLAVYESNIYEEGNLLQGNNLWVPLSENGESVKFTNMANSLNVENGGWSWAAQFGDFNNDGDLDLFVANGYISAEKGSNYWYDFATVTGGNESIISDTRNWAAMNGRSLSGYQTSRVWVNDGNGRFAEAAVAVGVSDKYDGRAVAVADLWNRGVLDVIVANQKAPVLIYKGSLKEGNHWISFDVKPKDGRSPVGTRLTLFWDGKKQTREIEGGSGYCSQNQRRAHFGIGSAKTAEKLEIRWPDGKIEEIGNPAIDKLHLVRQ